MSRKPSSFPLPACSAEMDRRREENLASEGFLWKVHLYLKYSGENGKCDIIVLPSISHGSLGNIEGINNLFPWQGWDSGSQLHQQSMKQGEAICWRGNNVGGRTDMGRGREGGREEGWEQPACWRHRLFYCLLDNGRAGDHSHMTSVEDGLPQNLPKVVNIVASTVTGFCHNLKCT